MKTDLFVLGRWSINRRLMTLLALTLAGFTILSASMLLQLRAQMYDGKTEKLHSLAATARSVVARYHALQQRGELTERAAQTRALDVLKALRYDGDNYFSVNDMTPAMVMHPMKPELDGQDLSAVTDPNGVALFVEMVDVVRAEGMGMIEYYWPRPGSDQPVHKV